MILHSRQEHFECFCRVHYLKAVFWAMALSEQQVKRVVVHDWNKTNINVNQKTH